MNRKAVSPNVVTLAEARLRRAMDGLGRTLDCEADAVRLSEAIALRLSQLPADERRLLRRDLAVSAGDLEDLVAALEAELGSLARELRAMNDRRAAVLAYHAAAIIAPRSRS